MYIAARCRDSAQQWAARSWAQWAGGIKFLHPVSAETATTGGSATAAGLVLAGGGSGYCHGGLAADPRPERPIARHGEDGPP